MIDKNLFFYMKRDGIESIPELSRQANIPATTLYDLVGSKTNTPSTKTIEKLALFFNIKINDLLKEGSGKYIEKEVFSSTQEILNYLMSDIHISERELERRTGVKQQTINKITSGKTKNPSVDTLTPLANFFNVTIEQLQAKVPLTNREKGTYNTEDFNISKIPHISWSQMFLLPDSLKYPEFNYINQNNINNHEEYFMVTTPNDINIDSLYPLIKKGYRLLVTTKSYTSNDLIICLINNTFLIGNITIKDNEYYLYPPNITFKANKLILGNFKYIGKIKKIIKNEN